LIFHMFPCRCLFFSDPSFYTQRHRTCAAVEMWAVNKNIKEFLLEPSRFISHSLATPFIYIHSYSQYPNNNVWCIREYFFVRTLLLSEILISLLSWCFSYIFLGVWSAGSIDRRDVCEEWREVSISDYPTMINFLFIFIKEFDKILLKSISRNFVGRS
jgi:hypothetical protein